ncbi:type II secretion system F family protein [Clostridiaceae bacterium HSG29]|nr:type II secretion system F family protein [Clostridiaceae bacterium HSG29]
MTILISILVFIIVFLLFLIILNKIVNSKAQIRRRLKNISNDSMYNEIDDRNEKTFYEKTFKKATEDIGKKLSLMTPGSYLGKLELKLSSAGLFPKITKEKWVFYKFASSISFSIIFTFIFKSVLKLENIQLLAIFIFVMLFVNAITYFSLSRKIAKRRNAIEKELPNAIDLITVTVEAGLSFDSAVDRFIKSTKSNLSIEFETMLKETRLGIQKKDALKNISSRCNVSDLSTFIGSIIQADELGVSITNILRIQSKLVREKRKQSAREKSMKAPIKLLFPILFFIFPTIFIILLGPVMIQLMEM